MEVAPRLRRGSSSLDVPAIGESPRQRHGSSSLAMPVFFSGPPTTEDKELLAKKERVNFIAAHSLAAGTVAEAQGSVLALNISTWNVKRKVFRSVKGRYRNIWVSVFLKSKATGDKYREVGRRECMSRPSQPHATCTVDIAYNFEQMQTLKFVCYDPKTSSSDEEDEIADQHVSETVIGTARITLGAMMGASGAWEGVLSGANGDEMQGKIFVNAKLHSGDNALIHMQFQAMALDRKDWFGLSDPYLIITIFSEETGQFQTVYKSETVMRSLHPRWKALKISLSNLCGGDFYKKLHFAVFDYDGLNLSDDLIGKCEISLAELDRKRPGATWNLMNPKKLPGGKKAKRGYTNSGRLELAGLSIEKEARFVNHLRCGLNVKFHVAVDFSDSNVKRFRRCPAVSLHDLDESGSNDYIEAINEIGEIMAMYDSKKRIPAYGFGARLGSSGPDWLVSQCFPLRAARTESVTESPPVTSDCDSIADIISQYTIRRKTVQFAGPSNFSPVIDKVCDDARRMHGTNVGTEYSVLLIVTDGNLTDVAATRDLICDSHYLPLSIIIVGVGDGCDDNFERMRVLASEDSVLLDSEGERCKRNIITFAAMDECKGVPGALAKAALQNVQRQVCEHMQSIVVDGTQSSKTGSGASSGRVLGGIPRRGSNRVMSEAEELACGRRLNPAVAGTKSSHEKVIAAADSNASSNAPTLRSLRLVSPDLPFVSMV